VTKEQLFDRVRKIHGKLNDVEISEVNKCYENNILGKGCSWVIELQEMYNPNITFIDCLIGTIGNYRESRKGDC